jgi:hypothetical protein
MVIITGTLVANVGGLMQEIKMMDLEKTRQWVKTRGEDSELFKQYASAQQLLVSLNNKRKWEEQNVGEK